VEDQVWYCGVQPEDVDEIVEALKSGTTVERLTRGTDKVTRNLIFSILEAGLLPRDV
jgi:(2Fe-2S) ferredoxin